MKGNIIFISGVKFETTPVLKYSKNEFEQNYDCQQIEYTHKQTLKFLLKGFKIILKTKRKAAIFFIGPQSLPLLFFFQIFYRNKLYYWALESLKFRLFNSPAVVKTLFLEYLISWGKINLLIPTVERLNFYGNKKFREVFIVSNSPPSGINFKKREISQSSKVQLVMYGRLDNQDIYLDEFIRFASAYGSYVDLHLIGWDFKYDERIKGVSNIFYHGFMDHDTLVWMLSQFQYSIIGYRPVDYNNTYCAPNKLYEAFSMSLPVIVNSKNPPLKRIIEENACGITWDFDCLDSDLINVILKSRDQYSQFNLNCHNLYLERFNLSTELSGVKNNIAAGAGS
ncbi:MAG TPA: hypothetical protein VMV74_00315 [Bacteroidales bacterium]|nr:hypothetical protein [Bacteroidales bacterium]